MINIYDATENDIPLIQEISEKTWWPTYSSIVSDEQIRFMLDMIYSTAALKKIMESGEQSFVVLQDDHGHQGFASYGPRTNDPKIWKLHKIYVCPDNHGKGYGKMLIEEIKRRMRAHQILTLDLNVNRHNQAKSFYEKLGFKVIQEEDVAIGNYWMNDYVMRLELQ
jgi:ribosomal protein S18 acetylase RimI-like enzyme